MANAPTKIPIRPIQLMVKPKLAIKVFNTDGPRAIIPANKIIDIPLPIPNSVICSPSHIKSDAPATNVMIMTIAGHMPSVVMIG